MIPSARQKQFMKTDSDVPSPWDDYLLDSPRSSRLYCHHFLRDVTAVSVHNLCTNSLLFKGLKTTNGMMVGRRGDKARLCSSYPNMGQKIAPPSTYIHYSWLLLWTANRVCRRGWKKLSCFRFWSCMLHSPSVGIMITLREPAYQE